MAMQGRSVRFLGASLIALATGCTQFSLPSTAPGTSASDVKARLGAPTEERTIGGAKAWDFVQGPQGFTTWRIQFDNADRVTKVEQILTEGRLMSLGSGKLTRADVSNLVGRPADVTTFAGGATEVWTYRFMNVTERKLGDVYFDKASGVAKQVTTYLDPAYTSGVND
jgi:hypothetical protein